MSLDWNIERVPNYKTRCWDDVPPEQQDRAAGIGATKLNNDTNALVWGSLLIDLPAIRKNNIEEWCFRIAYLKACDISWMTYFDDNDEIKGYFPDREAVEDHIGLSTNVSTMSRAKWLNKIKRRMEKQCEQKIARELIKREKEANQ